MISDIQFIENGRPNIMQKEGNYAKVKRVPPYPSYFWVENVGKIYPVWIFGINIPVLNPTGYGVLTHAYPLFGY